MSERLENWLNELRNELTDEQIAAGLGNGDVKYPGKWLSMAESTDHVKIWDNETNESQQMGFIHLSYGDNEE